MKTNLIVSITFLIITSILYFFGLCDWDLLTYILCVVVAIIFMFIFYRQEKKYNSLKNKEEDLRDELRRHTSN